MKTNIQNKWRLPAIDELEKVLYPNADKIPNLEKDSSYWSSTEFINDYAWYFYFDVGEAYYFYSKGISRQVRPVRDVSSDSTNSPNTTIIGNLEVHNEDLGTMNYYEAVEAVNKLNETKN
jgi:hypothetical protein